MCGCISGVLEHQLEVISGWTLGPGGCALYRVQYILVAIEQLIMSYINMLVDLYTHTQPSTFISHLTLIPTLDPYTHTR